MNFLMNLIRLYNNHCPHVVANKRIQYSCPIRILVCQFNDTILSLQPSSKDRHHLLSLLAHHTCILLYVMLNVNLHKKSFQKTNQLSIVFLFKERRTFKSKNKLRYLFKVNTTRTRFDQNSKQKGITTFHHQSVKPRD